MKKTNVMENILKMGPKCKSFVFRNPDYDPDLSKKFHHFYLPPADRPGTGDYKMPCVRACVRSSCFYKSLSIS